MPWKYACCSIHASSTGNQGRRYVAKFENILDTIGNTPVVRLNKVAPAGVNLFAKIEAFNPMGSVKDRLALGVIEDAECRGALKPGQTVVEATSGNTGIGLAMVCAQRGYPLVVTMAENFSVERRRLMRFLGAKVVLTPASEKGSGMLAKAVELSRKHGWFLCRQFENEANADMHSRTTAREILRDFTDESLDYWVTGYGTGGTLKGVGRVLKSESPNTRIVVCEPANAPVLGSGIAQERDDDGAPTASHPQFRPHLMQGWSPDFIPRLTEDAVAADWVDEVLGVEGEAAMAACRDLARREGIFVGISSGATLVGALEVARRAGTGANILCMLPDTGERYLSTPLFDDISAEMTDEETEISRSTPRYRFDASVAPAESDAANGVDGVDVEAARFVDETVRESQRVVMFSLQWCEFCWAVRKLFERASIPLHTVDLDSAEYRNDDWGGKIRGVLLDRTGQPTIPQIFVGGKHVGGCTEAFDAFNDGSLERMLDDAEVAYEPVRRFDAYELLPTWLHPR